MFIASFFVQLFGLANPLLTQVIIDKVLGQRSIETLNILGVFMIGVALFEALLTSLRTYLFVDTTNRIDLNLGSEVIDHLFRLPLGYFDKRRVGDIAGRVNELANIRQFVTRNRPDRSFGCGVLGDLYCRNGDLQLAADGCVPRYSSLLYGVDCLRLPDCAATAAETGGTLRRRSILSGGNPKWDADGEGAKY